MLGREFTSYQQVKTEMLNRFRSAKTLEILEKLM